VKISGDNSLPVLFIAARFMENLYFAKLIKVYYKP
jgi:tryptophanase